MAEGPYSIPVDSFQSNEDDFETWVQLFESAIILAYPTATAAELKQYFIKWLPLKLDNEARSIYKNVTAAEWKDKKEELTKLLVNPEEKYNWLAQRSPIMWDGKESLHTLAAKIIMAVNKYDPQNGDKEREYFFRFRAALPREYKKAIDMNCGEDRPALCTIAQAKTIACRLQAANAETSASLGFGPTEKTEPGRGAAMSDRSPQDISLQLKHYEIMVEDLKQDYGMNKRIESMERMLHDLKIQVDDANRRDSNYERDDRYHNNRDERRYHRDEDNYRQHSRRQSDDRRGNYDRRESNDRHGNYDCRESDDRRGNYDRCESDDRRGNDDRYHQEQSGPERPSYNGPNDWDRQEGQPDRERGSRSPSPSDH